MKLCVRVFMVFLCLSVVAPLAAWGKATVMRDSYGIPFIQADTEEELFESFGYTTAVDRLWQMEVNKRWSRGILAEVLGPKLVPADMQTRAMGYTDQEHRSMFEGLPADVKKLVTAYLKGANRRVEEVVRDPRLLPMEYHALKFKPQSFQVEDVLAFLTALLRRFGMVGGGELMNLSALQVLTKRFGKNEGLAVFNDWCWLNDPSAPTYIDEKIKVDFVPRGKIVSSVPPHLEKTFDVTDLVQEDQKLSALASREAMLVGAPVKLGSNSWTLSPRMTGTGFPILVGQPQMGFSVPTIIYEVKLKGGRFDVVGMAFPILPLIPIGHNQHLAWSHMVGMCDNVDIYQELLNPLNKEEYLFNGVWRKMEKRVEKIAIAGGGVREMTIYRTVHGPVFSPFPFDPQTIKEDRAYTKKLAHWQKDPLSLEGWLRMMKARNATEFESGASQIMTSLHTTYADIKGNIGYWHTGLNPERPEGFDPRFPLPGTGEAEWTGRYLPNAYVLNPAKGFVAGWNNKSSPDTRNPFSEDPNYHSFGRYNRSIWLDRALKGKTGLDLAANKEMARFLGGAGTWKHNVHNALGGACKDLLPYLARGIEKAHDNEKPLLKNVLEVLTSWDGRSVIDASKDQRYQAGQTIFLDWIPRVIKGTFEEEFEGIEKFVNVHNQIFGLFLRCLDGPASPLPVSRNYFDNIRTQQEESAEDIFLQTLRESLAHLRNVFKNDDPKTWQGPRDKIIFKHDLFGQVAEMWDNNIGTYVQIVELRPNGAVGYSRWPLGQSGNITMGPDRKPLFDPHFLDMLPLYSGYTYQKMGME